METRGHVALCFESKQRQGAGTTLAGDSAAALGCFIAFFLPLSSLSHNLNTKFVHLRNACTSSLREALANRAIGRAKPASSDSNLIVYEITEHFKPYGLLRLNPVEPLSHDYPSELEVSTVPEQPRAQRKAVGTPPEERQMGRKPAQLGRQPAVDRTSSHCLSPSAGARFRNAGLLIEQGASSAYTDLTQELFVQLLSKNRFEHYLDTDMTDSEIECEISQIELTNLLTAELRKRHPESYRLARRISTLIQSSANFRRFDSSGIGDEPHRRLADRVYGLSEWADDKRRRDGHDLEQRVQMVPVRPRDTRMVGCTGDSQVVISNSDLEDLIVSVLDAVDSPIDVRTLRSVVMSRLPVMDIYLVPLDTDDNDNDSFQFEPVDRRENPEQGLLRRESEDEAATFVDRVFEESARNGPGQSQAIQSHPRSALALLSAI